LNNFSLLAQAAGSFFHIHRLSRPFGSLVVALFTIRSLDWIYIFTNASYQVAKCPVDYLPRALRHMFTFFMPMLVISYYPAAAVCEWGRQLKQCFDPLVCFF
jgi:ABC-type uncharacterized transport system permease subunit